MTTFIIVGAGHAAGQAVASLRQEGFEGELILIGDEPHLPYQRPPLSKHYLAGEHGLDRVYLRPEKFYADRDVRTYLGIRVETLQRGDQTITLSNGETLHYDKLLLTTGSRARALPIPGAELGGVHYLRTIGHVDAIRSQLEQGKRMVVVGGGYIGLETAAVGIKAGLDVTVLEMESRILQRVTTESMSAYYARVHESHGVKIRCNTRVTAFEGSDHVEQIRCDDDSVIPADLVIIGVGILPITDLAEQAGLAIDDGIVVDEHCRTADPAIYAAGDCTKHPSPLLGRPIRLESVPNAMEQARVAAANMCDKAKVYDTVPWFWSDQYDLKLQMVGFSSDADQEVVRGDPEQAQFARFYLREGTIIAVDAVNSPREFMVAKKLVTGHAAIDADKLADSASDLKDLA